MIGISTAGAGERSRPDDATTSALRRTVAEGPIRGVLIRHGAGLSTLAGIHGADALLARLDTFPPRSPERDALLADLVRLHRRWPDGAALGVLLYTFYPVVTGRFARIAGAHLDPAEREAAVVDALVGCLLEFDPDRHSSHVEACVALNVRSRLRSRRRAEVRRRLALAAIKTIAEHAQSEIVAGEHQLADLIEHAGRGGNLVANDNEPVDVEPLIARLVSHRLLLQRDATILCRVAVQGRRIVDVAPDLGVSAEVAKKALQRARKRLLRRRRTLEAIFVVPAEERET